MIKSWSKIACCSESWGSLPGEMNVEKLGHGAFLPRRLTIELSYARSSILRVVSIWKTMTVICQRPGECSDEASSNCGTRLIPLKK